jgi:CRP-like cAMP-binding protein
MFNRNQIMEMLNSLEFFRGLSEREKNTLLAIVEARTYSPGEILCREGDRAFTFFVVCRGEVDVFKELSVGNRERLGRLGPGSMVGQVSLIDGKARSATVCAHSRVITLECTRDDFDRLFNAGSPFAYKIMDQVIIHLTRRLRDANNQVYNLYSRPTQTLKKLRALCLNIHRTTDDTLDSQPIDIIDTLP